MKDQDHRDSAAHGGADDAEVPAGLDERPLFQHRPWMVGVVLVFAFAAIVAGLVNPVWWLIGSPFILALVLFMGVRLFSRG